MAVPPPPAGRKVGVAVAPPPSGMEVVSLCADMAGTCVESSPESGWCRRTQPSS